VKKICMILVLCLVTMVAYGQSVDNSDRILITAVGADEDIPGIVAPLSPVTAETLIIGKIEFDDVSGAPLAKQVKFRTKIYDETTGEKIYIIEGVLENTMMIYPGTGTSDCEVRNVKWLDLWVVVGMGKVKTTGAITINYRGSTITLPDTEGEYMLMPVIFAVSPEGRYWKDGLMYYWPEGGWAFAGIFDFITMKAKFGGITYLTNVVEN